MEQYISLLISAFALLFVVFNYVRSGRLQSISETKEDSAQFASLNKSIITANVKLDTINSTVNETRTDIKSMDQRIQDVDKRVTVVERDLKTAFSQLDSLKGDNKNG